LTIFSLMKNHRSLVWTAIFLAASLLIWSLWPLNLGRASFDHPAAFGWAATGWPILALG